SVGVRPRVERVSSLTPRYSSSCATDFETAGCPTRSCRAAPEKDPVSTTRTNVSIEARRSILFSAGMSDIAPPYLPCRARIGHRQGIESAPQAETGYLEWSNRSNVGRRLPRRAPHWTGPASLARSYSFCRAAAHWDPTRPACTRRCKKLASSRTGSSVRPSERSTPASLLETRLKTVCRDCTNSG